MYGSDSGYEKWAGTGIEIGEKQEKWVQDQVLHTSPRNTVGADVRCMMIVFRIMCIISQ